MTVNVNGKQILADNFLYHETTYIPIRAVAEELGATVQYESITQKFNTIFNPNAQYDVLNMVKNSFYDLGISSISDQLQARTLYAQTFDFIG